MKPDDQPQLPTTQFQDDLLAVLWMLELHPELLGHFVFVQIGSPSRVHIHRYQELHSEVVEVAAEINWKFSQADIEERKFWKEYMQAYEACLSATSTKIAPWYVVPADDKENARLIISRIILDTFKSLKMRYPQTDTTRRQELLSIRQQLMEEAPDS